MIVPSFFTHMLTIEAYIEDVLEGDDYQAHYLVELVERDNLLQVFWDSDEGVTLAECQRLSRLIEAHIEEHGLMPETYKIDVSSPGLSRPLKLQRQYVKNIGRLLSVQHEGEKLKGRLLEVTDAGIKIDLIKSKKETVSTLFSWDEIEEAKVVPEFK